MVEETDGIEEAFEGQVRVLVTAAGQIGERLARAREQALRRAQARSEQDARELRSRLEAEHRAARAELGSVHRADWWDRATPDQIAHAYQVARAWAQDDPEAVRAEQRIKDELRTRYGVDADNTGAATAAVTAAMQRAEQQHAQEAAERHREQADRAEAHRLIQDVEREDRLAEEARSAAVLEPDPAERLRAAAEAEQREAAADQLHADSRARYDSAERRKTTADELAAKGIDQKVVATKVRADVSQGRPATEAVRGTAMKTTARRTRGWGSQRRRSGLER